MALVGLAGPEFSGLTADPAAVFSLVLKQSEQCVDIETLPECE